MAINNPQNFEIPTEDLTIGSTAYFLDSVTPTQAVNEIDVNNSAGEYYDSAYSLGKKTCSFTIRKVKASDALPEAFATFEYGDETWRIKTVTPTKNAGQVTSYALECDKVMSHT